MPATAHTPRTLATPCLPGVEQLVEAARTGRLVLYLGAGVSAAPPTNGPRGAEVANRLRNEAAAMLGCAATDVENDTLEELASKVALIGAGELARLKTLAASVCDFAAFVPNYGHRAVAFLMREGLAKVITVNWDCALESAGLAIRAPIAAVTDVLEAQSIANQLPVFKVHGSATRPASLKITQEEVNEPQNWAIAETQSTLTTGTIVFVGLATVGDYVTDPIESILREWSGFASAIRVVAPSMPDAWTRLLGTHADSSHFASYADDFLDDLLRAVLVDCLMRVAARADLLAGREPWAAPMAQGAKALRAALKGAQAQQILAWWRDGVTSTLAGTRFVTEVAGQNALLAIAYLIGLAGGCTVAGGGSRFHVASNDGYLEVLARPGVHLSEIEPVAIDHALRRWEDGAYVDGRPVTYVVVGAVGRFPARDAIPDIAAGDDETSDIGGDLIGPVRFIAAEEVLQGRL